MDFNNMQSEGMYCYMQVASRKKYQIGEFNFQKRALLHNFVNHPKKNAQILAGKHFC